MAPLPFKTKVMLTLVSALLLLPRVPLANSAPLAIPTTLFFPLVLVVVVPTCVRVY